MEKRKLSGGSGGSHLPDKKPKLGPSKHPSHQSKSSNASSEGKKAVTSQTAKTGNQTAGKTVWWLTQKAKRQAKHSAGTDNTVSKASAPPKSSKSSEGESKGSRKKTLQLKKKRQRKNRLQQKKMKSIENLTGLFLPDAGNPREPAVTGKKANHKERVARNIAEEKKKNLKSKNLKSKNLKSKNSNENVIKSTPNIPELSQSVNLQKSGGQKRIRKKVKKFKSVNNSKEAGRGTPEQTGESQMKGENTTQGSVNEDTKKARQDLGNGSHIEATETSAKTNAPNQGSKGEVSSNWKALLPMVEKSRIEHQKYKKHDRDGKNQDNPKPIKPDIWFDGVDPSLIKANETAEGDEDDDVQSESSYNPLLRKDAQNFLTKCLAMDCEMVGTGPKGSQSILARVSVVNQYGFCVCDKYITPREPVTDYRTFVSGIRPHDLKTKGESFEKVQKEVSDLLKGRVVVGHALSNDFKVLYFSHPRRLVRDTSTYRPFKDLFKSKRPGLKKLTELVLKVKVQKGEHNSVEDAQAAMKLYMLHRREWEKSLREKNSSSTSVTSKTSKKMKMMATTSY